MYIAAVASVSSRFARGKRTPLAWCFRFARVAAVVAVMGLFMLMQGLSGEVNGDINAVYAVRIHPHHAVLSPFASFRWATIGLLGFVAPPLHAVFLCVLLAAAKIAIIWVLLLKSGAYRLPGAWGLFDAVITTETPLRNTVFILYSFLIFSDAAESVALTIFGDDSKTFSALVDWTGFSEYVRESSNGVADFLWGTPDDLRRKKSAGSSSEALKAPPVSRQSDISKRSRHPSDVSKVRLSDLDRMSTVTTADLERMSSMGTDVENPPLYK